MVLAFANYWKSVIQIPQSAPIFWKLGTLRTLSGLSEISDLLEITRLLGGE